MSPGFGNFLDDIKKLFDEAIPPAVQEQVGGLEGDPKPGDICECAHERRQHAMRDGTGANCVYREERLTNDGKDKLVAVCDCVKFKWDKAATVKAVKSALENFNPTEETGKEWLCRCGRRIDEFEAICPDCAYVVTDKDRAKMQKQRVQDARLGQAILGGIPQIRPVPRSRPPLRVTPIKVEPLPGSPDFQVKTDVRPTGRAKVELGDEVL